MTLTKAILCLSSAGGPQSVSFSWVARRRRASGNGIPQRTPRPPGPPGHEFLAPHRRVLVARTSGQPSDALLPADAGLSQGLAQELQRLHLLLHLQHPEPGAGAPREFSGRRPLGGRRCAPPVPLGLRHALQVGRPHSQHRTP